MNKKIIISLLAFIFSYTHSFVLAQKITKDKRYLTKDTVVWEKNVLGNCILQLHANYFYKIGDNPNSGRIGNATSIILINNEYKQIVWDTSFTDSKLLPPILVAWLKPSEESLVITPNEFTFIVPSRFDLIGYLLTTQYDPLEKKWKLLGCYLFPLTSVSECHLLGTNTLWLYSHLSKDTPQIYQINKCGDLEIYSLKNVLEQEASIFARDSTMESKQARCNKPYYYVNVPKNEEGNINKKNTDKKKWWLPK